MRRELGRPAVHIEPRERVAKDVAMRERVLSPGRRTESPETLLEAHQLSQPFDVPPRQRQCAKAQSLGLVVVRRPR